MRIVHLSDLHFGTEDKAALNAAADFIAREPIDLVVVTGDLTAKGRRVEFVHAFRWLRDLAKPVITTPGNHDTPWWGLGARLVAPFGRFERASHGVETIAWRGADFSVATLNTARGVQLRLNWALGAVHRRQHREIARRVSAAPEDFLKIVAAHHPFVWPREAPIVGRTRGGPKAAEALIGAGARLFLSGHLHVAAAWMIETPSGSALCVSAGTLSERLRGEPAGFALISGAKDIVDVQHIAIDAGGVREGKSARFDLRHAAERASAQAHAGAPAVLSPSSPVSTPGVNAPV